MTDLARRLTSNVDENLDDEILCCASDIGFKVQFCGNDLASFFDFYGRGLCIVTYDKLIFKWDPVIGTHLQVVSVDIADVDVSSVRIDNSLFRGPILRGEAIIAADVTGETRLKFRVEPAQANNEGSEMLQSLQFSITLLARLAGHELSSSIQLNDLLDVDFGGASSTSDDRHIVDEFSEADIIGIVDPRCPEKLLIFEREKQRSE
mmetsp:Transcript_6099/g.18430  ORF Transcript_6099/g.18430 Transcript_6099/m.18430 type:complete len:206 (+) Transcript_6099:113-730(+)